MAPKTLMQLISQAKLQESFSLLTDINKEREPIIKKILDNNGNWLGSEEIGNLQLLTKLHKGITEHIQKLLGDESHD